MKILCLFILGLFLYQTSFSQNTKFNSEDSARAFAIKYLQFNLENFTKNTFKSKLPFSKISFFDVRYDTSYIAVSWQRSAVVRTPYYNQNSKFNLVNGFEVSLDTYFNEFYKENLSATNSELLCYVKKFSINPRGTMEVNADPIETVNHIELEVECYYKTGDTLFPATRIDTLYNTRVSEIRFSFPELVKDILQPLIEKVSQIDSAKVHKRNAYTLQQIQNRYQERFALPILTNNEYKRGIYKNFQEFKNNAPSVTQFTIRYNNFSTILYDSNEEEISTKIFGFSDGIACWIYDAPYSIRLVRVTNSFEFFSTLYILGEFKTISPRKFLHSLDMETGEKN